MKNVKLFVDWIVKCLVNAGDAALVIWLLHKMNVLDVPLEFIFYYGLILGTLRFTLMGLAKALDRYMKKNEED